MSIGYDGTVTKRPRLSTGETHSRPTSSIFVPFRTVGLVSPTKVPFTSLPLGKTTFQITTSVGRCLHTYDLLKGLNLVFITRPQTPEAISATCAWKDKVFAAWGGEGGEGNGGIWIFKRGKKIGELERQAQRAEPTQKLFVFGSWIVACSTSQIQVWKSTTFEHYTTITPTVFRPKGGSPLTGNVCSMPTYLNKIFVGKSDGDVDVWNVSTGKLVHTLLAPTSTSGPVTALEPASALSILAVAHADGSVRLRNVRTDKTLLHLKHKASEGETIDSISFRTDGLGAGEDCNQPGIMATASSTNGDVVLWDLNKGGRVRGVLRAAHNPPSATGDGGGINKVEFLPGQDVMVTSGMDNALKSWIFDANSLSPTPRILHSRSGHGGPVTRLSFVPSNSDGADTIGKWLMSAGRDQSLWGWSLRRDGQSTELSQGNVKRKVKKLGSLRRDLDNEPPTTMEGLKASEITGIACSLNRDGGMGAAAGGGIVWANTTTKKKPDAAEISATGWESVVTAHRGDKCARTWFWGRKKAGRWAFESGDGLEVTSVAITICGTFALLGSAGGSLSMYNLQSGILRQKFPAPLAPAQARKLKAALTNGDHIALNGSGHFLPGQGKHRKPVTGICVDNLNRTVISSGLDGRLTFWSFATGQLQSEIDWAPMCSITSLHYHRPNDLVALTCDDTSIRVVDIETKKLVRELWGCQGQIADCTFSHDGRWIIAASMDSVIRVWDLPTGHLINALRVSSPCTSLAFSDTGEYLATAHADSVGINIWNNRTLFAHVPTRPIREDETVDSLAPTTSGEHGQNAIEAAFDSDEGSVEDGHDTDRAILPSPSVDELSSNLLSLSLVPKSRWQTLLHLDTIRARNRPVEPPKKPEKAPFFLPSASDSLPMKGIADQSKAKDDIALTSAELTRITKLTSTTSTSTSTQLLASNAEVGDYIPFVTHLSTLPPAAADIVIRTLTPTEMPSFVQALTFRLGQKRDFELCLAWMAVFLRVHGNAVLAAVEDEGGELRAKLEDWGRLLERERARLGGLVGYCNGVLGFVRSVR